MPKYYCLLSYIKKVRLLCAETNSRSLGSKTRTNRNYTYKTKNQYTWCVIIIHIKITYCVFVKLIDFKRQLLVHKGHLTFNNNKNIAYTNTIYCCYLYCTRNMRSLIGNVILIKCERFINKKLKINWQK